MSLTDEIKARLDIVDVIGETVALQKSGRHYTGFCPFHSNTKTPSFVVFPETQTWRCFGACAEGGDVFSFVMKQEGYTFKEALDRLARRVGIERTSGPSSQQVEARQKLLEAHKLAASYFHEQLRHAPPVLKYLREGRGLTTDTITTFQLGYAPDGWENLKQHLIARGYTAEELVSAGLIVDKDGKPGYDRFRQRLMIPIRDGQGRVIGFGARALAQNQVPKYLNSPQTNIFDKSATLYGLDVARKQIYDSKQVVVVEGYMDVIQAYQRGAQNVVAQMGTSLTEAQLKKVARLARQIVMALDSDTAGNAATVRSLSVARQHLPKQHRATSTSRGIELEAHVSQDIYIATLPPGQDPDDVLKQGLEAWHQLINEAVPALDFYEQLVLGRADTSTPQGKSFVVRELIPVYREVADDIEKIARVERLARTLRLNEALLLAELKGAEAPAPPRRRPAPPPPPPDDHPHPPEPEQKTGHFDLETYCLAVVLAHPGTLAMTNEVLAQQELAPLGKDDFKRGEHREIFQGLQLWTASETHTMELLADMLDDTLVNRLGGLAKQWRERPAPPPEDLPRELSTAVIRLRLHNVREQLDQLKFLLQEAEQTRDETTARDYREIINTYSQLRRKLHASRDALSLTGKRRAENRFGQVA